MDHANAEILAAIGGPESSYDYTVINDTPATGDYSVGIWQINYYDGDYAPRVAEFGTPLDLIADGPIGQAVAAYTVWKQQGWMAWSTTYTSGKWRNYIGSGPVPHPGQPPSGPPGRTPPTIGPETWLRQDAQRMALLSKQVIAQMESVQRIGIHGLMI